MSDEFTPDELAILERLPDGVRCFVVAVTVRGERRYSRGMGPYEPDEPHTWTADPAEAFRFVRGTNFEHDPGLPRLVTPRRYAHVHASAFHKRAKVYRRVAQHKGDERP